MNCIVQYYNVLYRVKPKMCCTYIKICTIRAVYELFPRYYNITILLNGYYIVHYIVQYVLYINSTEILQYYYYTVLYSTMYCTQYQVRYMYYTMYYIILI